MATLAAGGRVTVEVVDGEIERLRAAWGGPREEPCDVELDAMLGGERVSDLDRFDRVQLADAISICRRSRSLSDAGRQLFAVSRTKRGTTNDADRLRKYLGRFGLTWEQVAARDR
jgi:transcriptional regulatory protein RtcR